MTGRAGGRRLVITFVAGFAVAAAWACQDGPTSPTSIGRPPSLNLAGTWSGLIGVAQASHSATATWVVAQSGSSVSGPITLNQTAANVSFTGTMVGTLSGSRVAVTYAIPRGNVPNFPDCSMSGTGAFDANATQMSGTLSITYTNCEGFGTPPAAADEVRLTKQ